MARTRSANWFMIIITPAIFALPTRGTMAQDIPSSVRGIQSRTGKTVPVAARSISRGATLTADDIVRPAQADSDVRTGIVAPGWVARKAIQTGEPLTRPAVTPPDLVNTGNTVSAVYRDNDVNIAVDAIAIGNGARGDTVYVRTQNRKRIRAVVTDHNIVSIIR